jgi:hypothetical protein
MTGYLIYATATVVTMSSILAVGAKFVKADQLTLDCIDSGQSPGNAFKFLSPAGCRLRLYGCLLRADAARVNCLCVFGRQFSDARRLLLRSQNLGKESPWLFLPSQHRLDRRAEPPRAHLPSSR